MSRLYLQKGGIDHFIDLGVQLDNQSYTPMSEGGELYELPNAFFAPNNELVFNYDLLSISDISFSVVREDTPQLSIPATTIGVSVIQYDSENGELDNKEYTLCNGDGLYYEQESPVNGAVRLVVKITNWSRAYDSSTEGKTSISLGGILQ